MYSCHKGTGLYSSVSFYCLFFEGEKGVSLEQQGLSAVCSSGAIISPS